MRPGILVPLCLSLLANPGQRDTPTLPAPAVEVVVRSGRVRLAVGREIASRSPRDAAVSPEGPFHLELGPRSEVEVVWRGLSSLRVRGPASFGVEPAEGVKAVDPDRPVPIFEDLVDSWGSQRVAPLR